MNNITNDDFCKVHNFEVYGGLNSDTIGMNLVDVKTDDNGRMRVVRWGEYKKLSLELANSFKRVGNDKYYRVLDCGSNLVFKRYDDYSLKLYQANFCKVRLCPMCAWRRSLKIFGQVSRVMTAVQEQDSYDFIFLTLTCRNVPSDELSNQLDILFKAFSALSRRKMFKSAVKGWFRCLEITHNWESGTFHPHFHVVLAVNKSYFDDKRLYISHDKWVDMWRSCLSVDYEPVVDVRRFRKSKCGVGKEVAEVAKYAVKPSDLFLKDKYGEIVESRSDEVISVLDKALANRRLVAFGGVLKDIHKKLNLDDIEEGDLVMTDVDDMREDLSYILVRYHWHVGYGEYKQVE